MTGDNFEKLMKSCGYSQTSLGKRWNITRQTVASCCKSEVVDPLYADAIKTLAYERQAVDLIEIASLINK